MQKKFKGLKLKEKTPNRIILNLITSHIQFCDNFTELKNILFFEARDICNELIIKNIILEHTLLNSIKEAFDSLKRTIEIQNMSEFKRKKHYHLERRMIDKHFEEKEDNNKSDDSTDKYKAFVEIVVRKDKAKKINILELKSN